VTRSFRALRCATPGGYRRIFAGRTWRPGCTIPAGRLHGTTTFPLPALRSASSIPEAKEAGGAGPDAARPRVADCGRHTRLIRLLASRVDIERLGIVHVGQGSSRPIPQR